MRQDGVRASEVILVLEIKTEAGFRKSSVSFLSYRKLRFHTTKKLREDAHSEQECAKAHFFFGDCRWDNKRRAGRCAPAGWYEKEVFQKKFFFIYALIIQVRCDRSLTER